MRGYQKRGAKRSICEYKWLKLNDVDRQQSNEHYHQPKINIMIKIYNKAIAALTLMITITCCLNIHPAKAQPGEPVTMQTFYDELEPYGQWIDDPEYGYVWSPDTGPDFKPYATAGHWIETEYGNTWVSDYNWGWAPFHYGRWRFAEDYGWEWIPGTEWGPAWVNWRTGGDYYGWAPLGPGIDIDISFGSGYYAPDNYWVFVPRQYVCSPNPYRYYLPVNRNYSIVRNTTIINNVYNDRSRRYISGPRQADIQRFAGNRINVYNINNSNRPGGARIRNNTINIYRPDIANNRNGNNNPAPNRVINRGNDRNNGRTRDDNNPGFNNGRQPINQGNATGQAVNPTNNNGFSRSRDNNINPNTNGNQFPQRTRSGQNTTADPQNSTVNGAGTNNTNPSGNFNRPSRDNQPNQPAQNTTGQPGNNDRISKDFDVNRNRTPWNNQRDQQNPVQQQIQQNQVQQQRSQQQEIQNQQRMQQRQQIQEQRQQQMQQNQVQQQRNQQQEMQNQQQNQQRQQMQEQRQQQNQQRQQMQEQRQQIPQQQRPARQEQLERRPERG